ncbi:MAG: glycosyltransferase family 2 protein [Paracoccaceae bacterium]
MKITAVTCVKNEGPFLIEWIAFHRVIGVTDFLIYSNDCDDATDALLDALHERGLVVHLANPAQGRNYQMEALKDARTHDTVRGADWVWIADVDEFLNIHVGDGTIPELIDACGNPQAISLNFQFFANRGVDKFVDEPVIGQFLHSHNPDIWRDQLAIEVKTLIRADFPTRYFGAHRPFFRENLAKSKHPSWSDGSGRDVPHRFLVVANKRRIRRFPAHGARRFATLNHYALRSLDSYLIKNARGDVNRENRDFDVDYWRERNDDEYFDDSILRYLERLKTEVAFLRSDAKTDALHGLAVERHREKLAQLMTDPSVTELRKRLAAAPRLMPAEIDIQNSFSHGLSAI